MKAPDESEVGSWAWLRAQMAGQGALGWLVGGAVRDRLLGRPSLDLDIAVPAAAVDLAGALAAASGGTRVVLDPERDIARVVWAGRPPRVLDIAALTTATIEGDLARRDFTVNALALPLTAELDFGPADLIDPTGGLADLRARTLRMTSAAALEADPLRMLRAVRLAAELGFALDPATAAAIARRAARAAEPAGERVRDELLRTLAAPGAARSVERLADLGLLPVVLPELVAGAGGVQPSPLGHAGLAPGLAVLAAVEAWAGLLAGAEAPADWPERWLRLAARHGHRLGSWFADQSLGARPRWTLLRLAALLRALGQAADGADPDRDRSDAQGPEVVRARVQELGRRLHLSQREGHYLVTVGAAWLRPLGLARAGAPSRRAVYRYFRATGAAGVDLALLALADAAGAARWAPGEAEALADVAELLWRAWFEQQDEVVRPPPLLRGQEVMAALGIGAGPELGRLLAALREAQAAGEIADRPAALALARRLGQGAGSEPR